MDLQNIIIDQLTPEAVDKIAEKTGLDRKSAQNAINIALPTIIGGLSKNAQDEKSAGKLKTAIEQDHSGVILDNLPEALGSQSTSLDGNKILGHIFGGKLTTVEQAVGKSSGISNDSAVKIMSLLAPVVLGQLGKEGQSSQGLDNTIGTLSKSGSSDVWTMISDFIDQNNDGSVVDDIANFASDLLRKK